MPNSELPGGRQKRPKMDIFAYSTTPFISREDALGIATRGKLRGVSRVTQDRAL